MSLQKYQQAYKLGKVDDHNLVHLVARHFAAQVRFCARNSIRKGQVLATTTTLQAVHAFLAVDKLPSVHAPVHPPPLRTCAHRSKRFLPNNGALAKSTWQKLLIAATDSRARVLICR